MKLWGGRFAKSADQLLRQFNDSIGFDQKMWREDINGSIAWAQALVKADVITQIEGDAIIAGLKVVCVEWETDSFVLAPGDEDIHTANERRLTEIVGSVGGKLHTGRSRNDQVATDFRLWTKRTVKALLADVAAVQTAIIDSAERNHDTPLPGYTHMQHAQPVTWGHWIMSHFWPLERDRKRLHAALESADELPLGSAALAGTAFPIDREFLAEKLGFSRVSQNSLDAVSNRDFVADTLYACAMLGVHLSRLSEQLIIFSSQEFGFVRVDDAYSTGSSLMPQKKNPDTLELTRGKSGRLIGLLVALMVTLKGLPSTYDKDLQEDKEGVFDAVDTLTIVLPVMAAVIETLQINADKMAVQLEAGLLATDLADYLVKKGLPFREAHHVVGAIVQAAEDRDIEITDLSLTDLQEISDLFSEDVTAAFSIAGSLAARNVTGGTAPAAVLEQIGVARSLLQKSR